MTKSNQIIVLFNNNSGGNASSNAKELQSMLKVKYEGLAPKQLDLFGDSLSPL